MDSLEVIKGSSIYVYRGPALFVSFAKIDPWRSRTEVHGKQCCNTTTAQESVRVFESRPALSYELLNIQCAGSGTVWSKIITYRKEIDSTNKFFIILELNYYSVCSMYCF